MVRIRIHIVMTSVLLSLGLNGCELLRKAVTHGKAPEVPEEFAPSDRKVVEGKDGLRKLGEDRLVRNEAGIWELYVEGGPYERGRDIGALMGPLLAEQERIFLDRIRKMIPSESYLRFLKHFVGFFTRKLDQHVTRDQQLEILGISNAASPRFDHIGPPFYRMLNYHAAHDIGHALQNMELVSGPMVGCTSFSVKGSASNDGKLLVGRNFDFHMGDRFARNKIAAFYKPDSGHPFMMVTWPGMTGAVSGMNKSGLSVTLNAARSDIPDRVGTPVSLIGREILQHASNIREAYRIAVKYRSFVTETFLVSSAEDGHSAVIEKTPERVALYRPDGDRLICTNHLQSESFEDRKLTEKHKKVNPTTERYRRVQELLDREGPLDPRSAAKVLRDHRGLGGERIGLGNERAVNQFVAHHSIIFEPEEKRVWLSASPYQLGRYVAYDLDSVFSGTGPVSSFHLQNKSIPPSELLKDGTYERFKRYKKLRKELLERLRNEEKGMLSSSFVKRFVDSNPEYFETHMLLGDLCKEKGAYSRAVEHYRTALEKAVPRSSQKEHIQKGLEKALRKSQ